MMNLVLFNLLFVSTFSSFVFYTSSFRRSADFFNGNVGAGLKYPDSGVPYVSGINIHDACGHNIDHSKIKYGYNEVHDVDGNKKQAQGKPFQEGDKLVLVSTYIEDYNSREYARIFSYMGQIRDGLICDLASITTDQWANLTEVLAINNIKTVQELGDKPPEQKYNNEGIFQHLKQGDDFHPKMMYLEEAELGMKCIGFQSFDFTNPEGVDGCSLATSRFFVCFFLVLLSILLFH